MKIGDYMSKLDSKGPTATSGLPRKTTTYRFSRRLLARQIYRNRNKLSQLLKEE